MSGYLIVSVVSATIGMAIGVSIFEASWAVAGVSYLIGGWVGMIALAAAALLNTSQAAKDADQGEEPATGASIDEWLEGYEPDAVDVAKEAASWEITLPHKKTG